MTLCPKGWVVASLCANQASTPLVVPDAFIASVWSSGAVSGCHSERVIDGGYVLGSLGWKFLSLPTQGS